MQSELRKNISEIEKLAYVDAVTGLANRARFEQELADAIADNDLRDGTISMIGLDHFKGVNDHLGHRFGDLVLREVGAQLTSVATAFGASDGTPDWSLSRFSADRYAMLIRSAVKYDALKRLADTIISQLDEPLEVGGLQVNTGCSIGIAVAEVGVDAEELFQHADLPMDAAKSGRRRAEFYSATVKAAAKRKASIESDLRDAIRTKSLDVYYQPILDCESLTITSAEALVRWRHPTEGFIEPSEFIPIAEESGLIVDVGNFVLARGLADFRRLHSDGFELTLAVNIAAAQLQRADFAPTIVQALSRAGFPAQALELELTESTALLASDNPESAIAPLRELGIRFAIDDFGTGHSSLGRLPSLAFDTLKIDRSFVADLDANEDNQAIIRLIVSLAGTLGMEIVTEGVEREEKYLLLREDGIQHVQGFLWCPALPFSELVGALQPSSAGRAEGKTAAG